MIKPVPEATAGMLLSHTVCELHGAQASLGLVFAPTRRVTCSFPKPCGCLQAPLSLCS